jgi:hypothetical protein
MTERRQATDQICARWGCCATFRSASQTAAMCVNC